MSIHSTEESRHSRILLGSSVVLGIRISSIALISALCTVSSQIKAESEDEETVYIGFETYDCSGDEREFETIEEMNQDSTILTYKQIGDDNECYSAQMEEIIVTARAPTSQSLLFNIFYTPPAFFSSPWETVNRNWPDEHYQYAVEGVNWCMQFVSIFRLWGSEEDAPIDLKRALGAEYHLSILDYHVERSGQYEPIGEDSDPGEISINGERILEKANQSSRQLDPFALFFQVLLHEAIHAGRIQSGFYYKDDVPREERTVQRSTYFSYKYLWGKEPPLSYAMPWEDHEKTPVNQFYKPDRDQIGCFIQ